MTLRRKLTGLAVLVGMIAALLAATTSVVGADIPATTEDARLELSLANNGGKWTLDEAPFGSVDHTENFSRPGCRLTETGPDDLVIHAAASTFPDDLTTDEPYVGTFKGEMGVKDDSDGSGTPCARVSSLQTLKLGLGAKVDNLGYVANGGTLVFSFKFDATVTVDFRLDGAATSRPAKVFDCADTIPSSGDCGPDSGLSDVGVVDIDEGTFFDEVWITTDGAVSLIDAGPDNATTHLHLVGLPITLSGIKFHDRDSDGAEDESGSDEPLGGWEIRAYESDGAGGYQLATLAGGGQAKTTTNSDEPVDPGDPPIGHWDMTLNRGTYTVCEVLQTFPADPTTGAPSPFSWRQTLPGADPPESGDCFGVDLSVALAPGGYAQTFNADDDTLDFGNVQLVNLVCNAAPITIDPDPVNGLPGTTVSISCDGKGSQVFPTVLDVGTSNDEEFDQFVVFGGVPDGDVEQTQTVFWLPEEKKTDPVTGDLELAATLVLLVEGGDPLTDAEAAVYCGAVGGLDLPGEPGEGNGVIHCLDHQIITGSPTVGGVEMIQLTEVFKFVGDPFSYRG